MIFNDDEKYAIELKFPRNKQVPETMFSFIKDNQIYGRIKIIGFSSNILCLFG